VNHLQTLSAEDDSVATTFIYCNYKEQAQQTVSNLVASLLRQIVQGRRAISDDVKSFFERHRRQTSRPTLDQLKDVLISEIRTRSKVLIIVDALDECREDDTTRALLLEVLRSLPRQVNLMVTSLPSINWTRRETPAHSTKRVLSWITYAVRPLSVKELQHALAVMPDTTYIDPDDITDDEILTSICAGLVVIDEERNVIGLVRK
jgi:hypothetical protein